MKKSDVEKTIGMLANLGVLAGIMFLAFEIHQSNHLVRAQTRYNVSTSIASFLESAVNEPKLIELYVRAIQAPASLDATGRIKLSLAVSWAMRMWEDFDYQDRQGLFDEDEFYAERLTVGAKEKA